MRIHFITQILWFLFIFAAIDCEALTNLPLRVSQDAQRLMVSWNVRSTTPAQAMPLFPDFYLETSSDLLNWQLLQSYRSNTSPRRITRTIPNEGTALFFRLRSELDL